MTIKQAFLKGLLVFGMIAMLLAVVPNRIVYADEPIDPIVSYTPVKNPDGSTTTTIAYQSGTAELARLPPTETSLT